MILPKLLNDILTGKDNQTFDYARVGGTFGILTDTFMCISETFHGHDFNATDYAVSIATIIGATCAGVWIKRGAEPNPSIDPLGKVSPKNANCEENNDSN